MERLFDVVVCDSMPRAYFQHPGKERPAAIPNLSASAADGAENELLNCRLFLTSSLSDSTMLRDNIALAWIVQAHERPRP